MIPSWNGRELLEKNLPKVLDIGADEVIIIENGSSDGSLEFLRKQRTAHSAQKLKIIENERNLGFARAVNQGFVAATGDVVVLLNTDVEPQKDILKQVLPHFKNNDVFAVSFNEGIWSWAKEYFKNGLIEHGPGEKTSQTHISFWASGGSAVFDRRKWLSLQGFSLIYEPFYWEDTDISYRAQKKGWIVLWEPKARVEHKHEATVSKHSQAKKKDLISQRNQLLFFWCNITSPGMWVIHILWTPVRLLNFGFLKAFLWAITKTPQVVLQRLKNGRSKISDEEILERFNS